MGKMTLSQAINAIEVMREVNKGQRAEVQQLRTQNAELLEQLATMRHLANVLALAWLSSADPNQWPLEEAEIAHRHLETLGYFDGMPAQDVTPSALVPLLERTPDLQLLERAGRGGILADVLAGELQALQAYPIRLMCSEQINAVASGIRTAAYALHEAGIFEPTDADEADMCRPVSEIIPLPSETEGSR